MNIRSRKSLLLAIFGITLLGSILGWLWVIQRLVENDARINEARIREAEQLYLQGLVDRLDLTPPFGDVVHEGVIKDLCYRDQGIAGIWTEEFRDPPLSDEAVKDWPEIDNVASSAELLARMDDFSWGHVENGRDRLGILLLKLAREEGDQFLGRDAIFRGLLNSYSQGRSMSSGFRLLLINEALKGFKSSPLLERFKLAEEIRAVEGRVEMLKTPLEVRTRDRVSFFYTREQFVRLLGEYHGPEIDLKGSPPDDGTWIKVPGLRHWPYLSLRSGLVGEKSLVKESQRAVRVVGVLTVLSTLGVIVVAIWVGRNELRRARSRTDLAASVAHELRTPLAGQRVVLENLEKRLGFASKQDRDSVTMALRENLRLGDLAESFLTFSKLDRGLLKIERHPVSLHQVVEQVMERFEPHWGVEDVVEVAVDPLMAAALADEASVATVLRNLVENAWKYSESPRRVRVRQIETDGEVGLSVTDHGPGLSLRDQQLVFNQFYQVDRRLNRSQGGLGLGLSIVKRLMDGMSGRTEIDSELGSGTTFRVFFERGGKP